VRSLPTEVRAGVVSGRGNYGAPNARPYLAEALSPRRKHLRFAGRGRRAVHVDEAWVRKNELTSSESPGGGSVKWR